MLYTKTTTKTVMEESVDIATQKLGLVGFISLPHKKFL